MTEEEKKERARLASKRYRERQKKKLEEGDARAQALREKKLYRTGYTSALAFIRKKIKRRDISAVRDALAERQKELMKLKKEKSKKD